MTGFLLDTNIVAGILRQEPAIEARFQHATALDNIFFLSSVVYYETKRGLLKRDAKKQTGRLDQLIAQFEWVDMLKDDWEEAARLWAERNRRGLPIAEADLLIAVQAKRLNAVLVTDNERDFAGLELQIENWRKK